MEAGGLAKQSKGGRGRRRGGGIHPAFSYICGILGPLSEKRGADLKEGAGGGGESTRCGPLIFKRWWTNATRALKD